MNAQAFRLYNTFTDASNYERATIAWSSNDLYVIADAAGTGAVRNIYIGGASVNFRTSATNRWLINSSGHFTTALDNTYDIGASGATRPRDLFIGRNFTLSGTQGIQTTASSTTFLVLAAGVAGASQMRLVQGVAPSAPVDGDIWREDNTNTGLKIRVNGVTKTITLS